MLLLANPLTRWYAHARRRNDPSYPADLPLLFDVNTEATIPTWWSAVLLLLVAGACGLLIAVRKASDANGARRWALLAVVFLAMSLDETVALHERLGSVVTGSLHVGATGALRHPWLVLGLLFGVALVLTVGWALATLPAGPRSWVAIGLGLYLWGALGIEAVSGAVLDAVGDGVAYAAVTLAEEGLEMLGALVLCCAILAALDVRVHRGAIRIGPVGKP